MKWLQILMDQERGPDGGGSGSPAGGDAGEAGAGAGAPPQAGEGSAAAGQGAGNGGTPSAWAPIELDWKGQKLKVNTLDEARALMQQGHDYTSKTQEVARLKKELLAKHSRADRFLAELEKRGSEGKPEGEEQQGQPEPQDKTARLEQQLQELVDRENERQWLEIFKPISQKFPDVPERDLAAAFAKAVENGEAENSIAEVERIAAELAPQYKDQRNQELGKLLVDKENPLVKTHNDKVLEAFLADKENPKLKAYTQQVIADYIAGKIKLKDAGGDGGKGGAAGSAKDEKLTIEQIAAKYSGE